MYRTTPGDGIRLSVIYLLHSRRTPCVMSFSIILFIKIIF
ncbi:hypothetical protein EDWATA_01608 [Edwardsiella tarda ATCC 23685]|uniref:Uncharacterized protein n=1 Tax=Edwardsiella tarda ATCC 23685 TaxID=500638 RepID=D4F4D7_EDWTA|nr:hypothetical protein EDWATA_01608 [Edwardsiella tarda ATCC 23685]